MRWSDPEKLQLFRENWDTFGVQSRQIYKKNKIGKLKKKQVNGGTQWMHKNVVVR